MVDDNIHPASRVSVACPNCGLQTMNPGVCDMCGKALTIRAVPNGTMYVMGPRAFEWRTLACTIGVVVAIGVLIFAGTSLVSYGKQVNDKPGLKPIRSSDDLSVSRVRDSVSDYASVASRSVSEQPAGGSDPMSLQLRTELDSLNLQAHAKLTNAGYSRPQPPADPRPTVVPDGQVPMVKVEGLDKVPEVFIDKVADSGNGDRFEATVTLVNLSKHAVSEYDLTLQVGDKVFSLNLQPYEPVIYPGSALEFRAFSGALGPVFGEKRLVLRAMVEGSKEATQDALRIP